MMGTTNLLTVTVSVFCLVLVVSFTGATAKSYYFSAPDKGEDVPFSFASYYGDHMVLQQAPQSAVIWGHAPVSAIGQTANIMIGNVASLDFYVIPGPVKGTAIWKVKLPPINQHGPFTVTVQAGPTMLTLKDVLFGDIWVCSGQSNMQFSMIQVFNASEELKETSSYNDIRVFTVALKTSTVPLDELIEVEEKWSVPSPETIGNKGAFSYFSAVCWLYGKYLYQKLGYPIGLVDTDWGGTPVEAWSSPDALAKCRQDETLYFEPYYTPPFKGPSQASVLWNAMIHPLLNMTIYGAIWYQGEANAGNPDNYNCTFPAMIDDWRVKFNEGSLGETDSVFPFGFVQLAGNRKDGTIIRGFSDIRWHQTADYGFVPNERMPNTFMSVAMDLPDFTSPYGSVHPRDKQDVAQRLTLAGLAVAYKQQGIKFQGPWITAFTNDQENSLINFVYDNDTSPIVVKNTQGFEICCSSVKTDTCSELDTRWKPVRIVRHDSHGGTISYSSCPGMSVVGLRYEWRESPCLFKQCAVYSQENDLPAPPFIINGLVGIEIKTWQQILAALKHGS